MFPVRDIGPIHKGVTTLKMHLEIKTTLQNGLLLNFSVQNLILLRCHEHCTLHVLLKLWTFFTSSPGDFKVIEVDLVSLGV